MRVIYSFRMPVNSYVGGIASILNQYREHEGEFSEKGVTIDFFDYHDNIAESLMKCKLGHFIQLHKEKKALLRKIKDLDDTVILHVHSSRKWQLLRDLILLKYVRNKSKCKVCLSIHFAETKKILYNSGIIKALELSIIRKYVDRLILLSQATKDEFVSLGMPNQKIRVLYTFHNYQHSITESNNSAIIELLFMGSLDSRKGILDLLCALEKLNHINFRLHICGNIEDNPIKEEFLKRCERLKEKVVLEGYVTGSKKAELFALADILVLPSYGEGMPIVIMEAMACGCSILTTNVGAIPEIVQEKSGELILPGDIDAMCSAIEKRADDRALLEKEKAYNFEYGKQFSLEKNIDQLSDIYYEMLLDT